MDPQKGFWNWFLHKFGKGLYIWRDIHQNEHIISRKICSALLRRKFCSLQEAKILWHMNMTQIYPSGYLDAFVHLFNHGQFSSNAILIFLHIKKDFLTLCMKPPSQLTKNIFSFLKIFSWRSQIYMQMLTPFIVEHKWPKIDSWYFQTFILRMNK